MLCELKQHSWEAWLYKEGAKGTVLKREDLDDISLDLLVYFGTIEDCECSEETKSDMMIAEGRRLIQEANARKLTPRSDSPSAVAVSPPADVAPVKAPEAFSVKASVTAPPVAYPLLPLKIDDEDHDKLVERAVDIAVRFRRDRDYSAVRDEFIHVALALNQLGLLAPAFRDQPRIPYDKKLWSRYTQLLIDLIVIDCHWLFCRGERVSPRWAELKGVFDCATPFDCALIAEQVGAKNWTPDFRVDELIRLSRRQQLQLVQLRGEAVRQSFRVVLDGGRAFEDGKAKRIRPLIADVGAKITDWADRNHRVQGHEMMYESLWLASALLGDDASVRDVGELAALRCGRPPLDRKTVAGKLKVLRNVLGSDGDVRQTGVSD